MNYVLNERTLTNLSIVDAKNYNNWYKEMKVLFDYQDVLEVIKNCVNPLAEGAMDVHRATHKEERKKRRKNLRHCFLSINVWMVITLRKSVVVNHRSKHGKS